MTLIWMAGKTSHETAACDLSPIDAWIRHFLSFHHRNIDKKKTRLCSLLLGVFSLSWLLSMIILCIQLRNITSTKCKWRCASNGDEVKGSSSRVRCGRETLLSCRESVRKKLKVVSSQIPTATTRTQWNILNRCCCRCGRRRTAWHV